jgi:hypothetical protein
VDSSGCLRMFFGIGALAVSALTIGLAAALL